MASLENLGSNDRANEVIKSLGYRSAEEFKDEYVKHGTEYDIKYDTRTLELILVKKSDSSVQEPTGVYIKR